LEAIENISCAQHNFLLASRDSRVFPKQQGASALTEAMICRAGDRVGSKGKEEICFDRQMQALQ
jgi:hypothetical protein